MHNSMIINLDGQEKEVEIDRIDIETGLQYPVLPSDNEYEIHHDIMGNCFVFLTKECREESEIFYIKNTDELPQLYEIYEGNKMAIKIEQLDAYPPYDIDVWRFRIDYVRVRL